MHHLGVRARVEAALRTHAGKLLLLIEHHLLLIRLATLLLRAALVAELLLPGIIETIPALEHGWLQRRARDVAYACRSFSRRAIGLVSSRSVFLSVLYRQSVGGDGVERGGDAYCDNGLADLIVCICAHGP